MSFGFGTSYKQIGRALVAILLATSGLCAERRWIDAYQAQNFDEALAIADHEIQQQPRDPKAWTERALSLAALNRNPESITSFERALSVQPTFLPALRGAAELTYKNHDPQAGSFLARLLKADPRDATAHAMAGVLAFERRDCAGATEHFEQSGPELASNPQAYSFYGSCLLELGKAEKAVPIFSALLEQASNGTSFRYNLGNAQLSSGDPLAAIRTLAPLTSGEHPDPAALNLIASAEAESGDLRAALQHLRTAAQLKPDAEENYLDFASLCLEHDSVDLAEEIVEVGLEKIPNSARLYSMRGIIEAQAGKFDASTRDFEEASRLSPDKSYGAVGLSMLFAESKNTGAAEEVLRGKAESCTERSYSELSVSGHFD